MSFHSINSLIPNNESCNEGLTEIRTLISRSTSLGIIEREIRFDSMLARGLDYYTGAIFEVRVKDSNVGSICGGGRYDDLTGIFGWKGMSGVGISFGADRIEDVLEHFNLFPEYIEKSTDVLIANMSAEIDDEIQLASDLRAEGHCVEIFPDTVKLKKQLKYADDKSIPFVVIIGEDEKASNSLTLKCMSSGEQTQLKKDELKDHLS